MELIGQDSILKKIKSLIDKKCLPQSMIIEGPKGCGKHTLVKLIGELSGKQVVDISEKIDFDFILSLYTTSEKPIYLIDCRKFIQKRQNEVLKLIEEPPQGCNIILLCNVVTQLLPTIQNRCERFVFERYTKETLAEFLNEETNLTLNIENNLILSLCSTPGEVIQYKDQPLFDIINFCKKIIEKIGIANHSNVFRIVEQIRWKDEKEGYDLNAIYKCLEYVTEQFVLVCVSKKNFDIFFRTLKLLNDSEVFNVNQKQLFEQYLFDIKGIVCG